ncbi:glycosyltransferase family 4 protein [Planctomycetota bacterium]
MIAINKRTNIAFICSFIPRNCGIATFSSDLISNVRLAAGSDFEPTVIAMQPEVPLKYQKPVKLSIRKNIKLDYIRAAQYINSSDIDLVSIQHEFGLFGGSAGDYLNILLKRVKKPIITTLHTILENPASEYYKSLVELCKASQQIIVMNTRGIKILRNVYGVSETRIKLIPHGIPDIPFSDGNHSKRRLGLNGRKTILTFGLLSRNKGIEVMIRALPKIIKTDPTILYVVLGTTHPEVLRSEGPSYKNKLKKLVDQLNLQKNVLFRDRFVEDSELFRFLTAADIYVTPYLHEEQLTSGTLAFAVGAGKAVVSTPYWAAQELLANDRGRLVGFGDSQALAKSIIEIIQNDLLFTKMRSRAYKYGRTMTWPRIGHHYWKLFQAGLAKIPATLRLKSALQNQKTILYNTDNIYQSA